MFAANVATKITQW